MSKNLSKATPVYWTPPMSNGEPSHHQLPKGWWESHEEIGEPHTSKQLEDWFNTNHKCTKCHKIIRSHQNADMECKIVNRGKSENSGAGE